MTKSADSSAPVGVVAPQADARTLKAARVTPRSVSPMETDPPMACAANMGLRDAAYAVSSAGATALAPACSGMHMDIGGDDL